MKSCLAATVLIALLFATPAAAQDRQLLGVRLDDVMIPYANPRIPPERGIGAEVKEVFPGSVAEAAGLQVGDIVESVGFNWVFGAVQLREAISEPAELGGVAVLQVSRPDSTLPMGRQKLTVQADFGPCRYEAMLDKYVDEKADIAVARLIPAEVAAEQMVAGICIAKP